MNSLIISLNEGKEIKTKELWECVNVMGHKEFNDLTSIGIQSLLDCEEVFIRAVIVNKIFKYCFPDLSVVDRIFSEAHPAIIVEAIKGVFEGYRKYSSERKAMILDRVKTAMGDPIVIIRGETFFSTFGLGYASESLEFDLLPEHEAVAYWNLWAEIFPLFLDNFSKNRTLSNSGRFSSNLTESFNFISEIQRIKIAESLYNWIDIRLKNNIRLDTDELSVIHYLYENNEKVSDSREILLRKCINHWHTGFATLSFSSIFWYWDLLSENEIVIILDCLDQNRADVRWFKAIAITSRDIPPEIQEKLLGNRDYFNSEISTIIDSMPKQLLYDALDILMGYYYEFSRYQLHRRNREVWQQIKEYIIIHEIDPKFSLCLRDMLLKFTNSGEHNSGYSQPIKSIWTELCANSGHKKRLLNSLIQSVIEVNYAIEPTKILFEIILDSFGKDVQEAYMLIAENAERMQNHNIEGSDFFVIMRKHLNDLIRIEPLQTDGKIYELILELLYAEGIDSGTLENKVDQILSSFKIRSIRLKYLPILIDRVIEKYPVYSGTLSKLRAIQFVESISRQELITLLNQDKVVEDWYEMFNAPINPSKFPTRDSNIYKLS